jgi:hypothetical protein
MCMGIILDLPLFLDESIMTEGTLTKEELDNLRIYIDDVHDMLKSVQRTASNIEQVIYKQPLENVQSSHQEKQQEEAHQHNSKSCL